MQRGDSLAAAVLLILLCVAKAADDTRNATRETEEFMERLEGAKLISGILGIQKNGRLVYERAFGEAIAVSSLCRG